MTVEVEPDVASQKQALVEPEGELCSSQSSTASSVSAMSKPLNTTSRTDTKEGIPIDEETKATSDSACSQPINNSAPQPSTTTVAMTPSDKPRSNNNANKNPFEAFNEYVAFFFRKAEVYEEELERRESKVDLRASMDVVRHGSATLRYNGSRIELAAEDSGIIQDAEKECAEPLTSPRLSPTTEAIAAVEAISNFRPLSEVRKEIEGYRSHSFGPEEEMSSAKGPKSVLGTQDDTDAILNDDEMKEKWDGFCNGKKQNAFDEVAIQSVFLRLTVQEFYDLVLKDDAPNSFGKFMTNIGDMNVETTFWEPGSGQSTSRSIHYIHPVNVPMAPPTAKAFKTQNLYKFGTFGLCLESSTIVEDVPMTDCFVVDDRLWVRKDSETNGCVVNVTFQIRFVKTTMFRRIIQNATRLEFLKWWKQFEEMVSLIKGASTIVSPGEDLDAVATELEEVTMLLEEESVGLKEPLSDALKKIRSSSHRLSMVAKRASVRRVTKTSRKVREDLSACQYLTSSVDCFVSYLKEKSQFGITALGSFAPILFLMLLNMWTNRQLAMTNQILSDVDARLTQLSAENAILLSKLDRLESFSN
eukprot:CCRYP_010081-RA/>CCRYP_010081-RA protein AED:0.28 eAED:0.28 QI:381/1/1/1/1/1/2/66/585